jgi:hypothetical protein
MAEKAGLGRVEVVRVEGGQNDATSYRMRAGLARAAQMGVEDLSAYLDGEIDLEAAMRRRARERAPIAPMVGGPDALPRTRDAPAASASDAGEQAAGAAGATFAEDVKLWAEIKPPRKG